VCGQQVDSLWRRVAEPVPRPNAHERVFRLQDVQLCSADRIAASVVRDLEDVDVVELPESLKLLKDRRLRIACEQDLEVAAPSQDDHARVVGLFGSVLGCRPQHAKHPPAGFQAIPRLKGLRLHGADSAVRARCSVSRTRPRSRSR